MKNNNQPTNEQIFTIKHMIVFLLGAGTFLTLGAILLINLNA